MHLQVGHEQYAETTAACAEALVTVRWLGFHRVWQGSGEAFDHVDLFLPDVQFPTQVCGPCMGKFWYIPVVSGFSHVFMVAVFKKQSFDVPEAGFVAGYSVEYSSMGLVLFFFR